jgi:hypothetical protein
MTSEQLAADRRAFIEQLLVEKRLLERSLAAVDAAIMIYTGNVVTAPPPAPEATPEVAHYVIQSDLVMAPEPAPEAPTETAPSRRHRSPPPPRQM